MEEFSRNGGKWSAEVEESVWNRTHLKTREEHISELQEFAKRVVEQLHRDDVSVSKPYNDTINLIIHIGKKTPTACYAMRAG
jgi:hypothetical protein